MQYSKQLGLALVLPLLVAACAGRSLDADNDSEAGSMGPDSDGESGSDGSGEEGTTDGGLDLPNTDDLPPQGCLPVDPLPYEVVDAESIPGVGRIILAARAPNELHTLGFGLEEDATFELPREPWAVSISPDGAGVAVGHDGLFSYIDLEAQTHQTQPIPVDIFDIVLAENGWVYGFPASGQWTEIVGVEIETGTQVASGFPSIREQTKAKLNPGTSSMYGANNGLSPSDIERYDILDDASPILAYDSPYHGDYPMCGDLWVSVDGDRIFTACGNTFWTSDVKDEDMIYAGSLENVERIRHLDQAPESGLVAMIPGLGLFPSDPQDVDEEVLFFDGEFLGFESSVPLPRVDPGSGCQQPHGRFVFFDESAARVHVIAVTLMEDEVVGDTVVLTLDVPD